jgi:hypothetical protein
MSGPKRRAFEAEMTLKYCQGNPLQAETVFGWGRHTVAVGLAERRTGIICLGAQSAFSGRQRWEEQHPEVAAALRRLAEAHAQQDPPFRTTLAYTRLTTKAALEALRAHGYRQDQLPACVFHAKAATCSRRIPPPIPRQSCYLFHTKAATDSIASLPPIPGESCR